MIEDLKKLTEELAEFSFDLREDVNTLENKMKKFVGPIELELLKNKTYAKMFFEMKTGYFLWKKIYVELGKIGKIIGKEEYGAKK